MASAQVIIDYSRRPLATAEMTDNVQRLNQTSAKQGAVRVTTSIFPQILSNLSQGAVIFIGGLSVVDGRMSVGTVLALFSIFRVMGAELTRIYGTIVTLLLYSAHLSNGCLANFGCTIAAARLRWLFQQRPRKYSR